MLKDLYVPLRRCVEAIIQALLSYTKDLQRTVNILKWALCNKFSLRIFSALKVYLNQFMWSGRKFFVVVSHLPYNIRDRNNSNRANVLPVTNVKNPLINCQLVEIYNSLKWQKNFVLFIYICIYIYVYIYIYLVDTHTWSISHWITKVKQWWNCSVVRWATA